jgi:sigma-B regulation protein RsbU (phosphoserine phosphatase)
MTPIPPDIVETLQRVFRDLSSQELEALAAATVARDYPPGSLVCREGELEHVFYIIQEGEVAITHRLPDGSEQTLGVQGPNSFFGEIGLLENRPRSASVRTLNHSRLLEVTEDDFKKMVDRSPEATLTVLRGVIRSLRETDRVTIEELQAKNLELERAYADLKAAQSELVEQERFKRELEIAADVQRSIMPAELPHIPGFEFATYARPAREVGGDYYDLLPVDDDYFGLVMADVSGKSIHAAIYMAVTRALFLAKASDYRSPQAAVQEIHELLMNSSDSDMFVTAFYGVVNRQTREMCYVRAGHDWPIHFRPETNQLSMLQAQGRFLGILKGLVLNEAEVRFLPGDALVCYSDGLTDATSPDGAYYGIERLKAVVASAGHKPARDLVDTIIADVDYFRAGVPQPDDLTLLVMKVK